MNFLCISNQCLGHSPKWWIAVCEFVMFFFIFIYITKLCLGHWPGYRHGLFIQILWLLMSVMMVFFFSSCFCCMLGSFCCGCICRFFLSVWWSCILLRCPILLFFFVFFLIILFRVFFFVCNRPIFFFLLLLCTLVLIPFVCRFFWFVLLLRVLLWNILHCSVRLCLRVLLPLISPCKKVLMRCFRILHHPDRKQLHRTYFWFSLRLLGQQSGLEICGLFMRMSGKVEQMFLCNILPVWYNSILLVEWESSVLFCSWFDNFD